VSGIGRTVLSAAEMISLEFVRNCNVAWANERTVSVLRP
jgi:hypothetical protein